MTFFLDNHYLGHLLGSKKIDAFVCLLLFIIRGLNSLNQLLHFHERVQLALTSLTEKSYSELASTSSLINIKSDTKRQLVLMLTPSRIGYSGEHQQSCGSANSQNSKILIGIESYIICTWGGEKKRSSLQMFITFLFGLLKFWFFQLSSPIFSNLSCYAIVLPRIYISI